MLNENNKYLDMHHTEEDSKYICTPNVHSVMHTQWPGMCSCTRAVYRGWRGYLRSTDSSPILTATYPGSWQQQQQQQQGSSILMNPAIRAWHSLTPPTHSCTLARGWSKRDDTTNVSYASNVYLLTWWLLNQYSWKVYHLYKLTAWRPINDNICYPRLYHTEQYYM